MGALAALGCTGEMIIGPGNQGTGDGGGDGAGGSGSAARELFDELNPQQVAECGPCHAGPDLDDIGTGPDYLGPAPETSYATILAYRSHQDGSPIVGDSPQNSKLYVYGAHTGPAMSSGLAAKVAGWIAAQAVEGGTSGSGENDDDPPAVGAPTSLVEALTLFADCMTFADFQTTQFANVAAQNTAQGQCYSCHSQGTGGAYLSQDGAAFYDNQRAMPYILKFATGTVNEDGSFKDLVLSGRYESKQADNGHPNYLMDPARLQSIQAFYDLTYGHYRDAIESGTACTRDTPVDPPPQ